MPASSHPTSITLLGRLANDDAEAWVMYRDLYAPLIYFWCRKFHLQPTDAEAVSQDVLIKVRTAFLAAKGPERGKFRSWLRPIVYHACIDQRNEFEAAGGDINARQLAEVPAAEDDATERILIVRKAFDRLENRCSARDMEIFMAAIRGECPQVIADRQVEKITRANIYVIKSRVKEKLLEIYEELIDEDVLGENNDRDSGSTNDGR